MEDLRAAAEIGVTYLTAVVVATRGERLVLIRGDAGNDKRPDALQWDVLQIAEIDAGDRIAAIVTFDLDDIDAAFAELDARHLTGEAAAHAHTWSVIAHGYTALNRQELPATTSDWVNIDHRRGRAFVPGDLFANLSSVWDLVPDISTYIEAVHRQSNLGAVVTHVAHGTSQDGFEAEWREINLLTVEGDLINRCEMFDEADIDAALARFEVLQPRRRRLENAASRVGEHFVERFAARNWNAMAEMLADGFLEDDRRRVANAGIRHGRDAEIEGSRAAVDLGITNATSAVIATRGERVALVRTHYSDRDQARQNDVLQVVEIDADEQIEANVVFDLDDIDAAFEELDARYLAGEAAAHAHTWSVITRAHAAFNRHVMPPTTPDWVNIDHRRVIAFAPGDMTPYMRATLDVAPDIKIYIEAVHRLSNLGAVFTQPTRGISHEGFAAEWRDIILMSIEGDQFNRCEIFDEADLDAALARFDELSRPAPQLENAASQVYERIMAHFAARDWDAVREILAEDISTEDRRRVVNAGRRQGRDAVISEISAIAEVGITKLTSEIIATRGGHLCLSRGRGSEADQRPDAFRTDLLDIVEVDADERVVARVVFDIDDIDAAFEELDARYLAGEAAAHARTWSVIARSYAALNRGEPPATTQDWVNIDHRLRATIDAGDLTAYLRAAWDLTPNLSIYIAAVHRLSDLGAVVTHASHGTSQEGFDAEWRMIELLTVEGSLINRCELFDEADIYAAIARFDELSSSKPRLENAASGAIQRFQMCFAARDWDAMAGILADDISAEDHRPVLRAGTRHGREVNIGDWRTVAEVGFTNVTSTVIALRGERLALGRFLISTGDHQPEAFQNDVLGIVEINADHRISTCFMFELDDFEGAVAELDARYLAGEAADHSHTWSLIAQTYAAFNRHELAPTTPDWARIDRRRGIASAPGDMAPYIRAAWNVAPNVRVYVEAAHRLSSLVSCAGNSM
jgi:hypothetical protein